jgi:transposase
MSENEEKQKKPRRKRREFTPEFKAGAVKLVLEEGKTTTQVAQDLDLTESALRIWVQQAKADRGEGKPGALTAEREELSQLRKRVRQLEMEKDILKNPPARLGHLLRQKPPVPCRGSPGGSGRPLFGDIRAR